jgi:hypothetical protein
MTHFLNRIKVLHVAAWFVGYKLTIHRAAFTRYSDVAPHLAHGQFARQPAILFIFGLNFPCCHFFLRLLSGALPPRGLLFG